MSLSKLNIRRIVDDHLETLEHKNKANPVDVFLFFFIPSLLTVSVFFFGFSFSDGVLNALIAAFSLLTGFFLNLMVLLLGIIEKFNQTHRELIKEKKEIEGSCSEIESHEKRQTLLEQTFKNVSYSVLVSLVLVLLSVLSLINDYIQYCSDVLISFLGLHLLLTILMILKRMHTILALNVSTPSEPT